MKQVCRSALFTIVLGLLVAPVAVAGGLTYNPEKKTLYSDGPSGRYLLGGEWLFKADPGDVGLAENWVSPAMIQDWLKVSVPNAWNAKDDSLQSMLGGVGWYRKEFTVPERDRRLRWIVRFESVNYKATVWLNGRIIGTHRGGYAPFEFELPNVDSRGKNVLVVRVDSRESVFSMPPGGSTKLGNPRGGWWNYGGILREAYLRRVDTLDWVDARVRSELGCDRCPARVNFHLVLRNSSKKKQTITARVRFAGTLVKLGEREVAPGARANFDRSMRLPRPRLWSPRRPNLYRTTFDVRDSKARPLTNYLLHVGLRSVKVVGGRLTLNGRPMNFRGVGLHEQAEGRGAAIAVSDMRTFIDEAKAIGATVIRSHYPLHPKIHELADQKGLMIWSEVPVYQLPDKAFERRSIRRAAADLVRKNIQTNQNHPSILLWSVGNELNPAPSPAQRSYIYDAVKTAHKVDPTLPVALAIRGYPSVPCPIHSYKPLEVIGVNDYFGWYTGPKRDIVDRAGLSPYLDTTRACYPKKAIVVSEFGAEANRHGPVSEKGTFEFQSDFVNYHLGVFATKPWLSGALYWALREFRVRPLWVGGNPQGQPPLHQKGLITMSGERKPAWTDVRRAFDQTKQIVLQKRSLRTRRR